MRHLTDPNRCLMSRSRVPELVQPQEHLRIHPRFADRQVYKARPDVNAVCHHHAPSQLPFCVAGMKLKPLNHLGATMGDRVPVRDSRDEFGKTSLLVAKPEESESLARALGENLTVRMCGHGAAVSGRSLEETIYTLNRRNAAAQIQAELLGAGLESLNAEEVELAVAVILSPGPVACVFEYWSVRLDEAEGNWRPAKAKPARKARMSTAKKAKKKTARKR